MIYPLLYASPNRFQAIKITDFAGHRPPQRPPLRPPIQLDCDRSCVLTTYPVSYFGAVFGSSEELLSGGGGLVLMLVYIEKF